ncbi:hypothetical protein NDU88_003046 [Pleurodeles waltl]|uniref:Uncharacterized protein n=1 Tax=Pleurodeles waltl TaxID=8319 RepID=A0AAV7UEN7_PLEWA|nr:hypothetical protein NDU88_003046 [Pleurodeles waltl]
MVDVLLYYYWMAQLLVFNDWMSRGWGDPVFQLEVARNGLEKTEELLYGNPIPSHLPKLARVDRGTWHMALRWTGWDQRYINAYNEAELEILNRETPKYACEARAKLEELADEFRISVQLQRGLAITPLGAPGNLGELNLQKRELLPESTQSRKGADRGRGGHRRWSVR